MIKKLFFIILIILSMTTIAANTFADLGNFNDYSSDTGSGWNNGRDYGNSGSGGYGSGYGGYYHTSSEQFSGMDPIVIIVTVIVVIIIAILTSKIKGMTPGNTGGQVMQGGNISVPNNTEEIVASIMQNDPNFSNEKFIGWVKEVFFTLQSAWSDRDFEKCRPFEKEELYQQHCNQIQNYKDRGWINKLDRINVNQAYLYQYTKDSEYEYLKVYLQTRMSDYIIDEKTNAIIKGDPNADYFMKYLYTFIRKNGVLTDPAKSNHSTVSCPHCGAPTQITSAGKCEYCNFIVTTGEYDWVLADIESIKNNSNLGRGGVLHR